MPLGFVCSRVCSQVRGFGYEVSFKGNENNSIIQPQLKLNGVKLGLMAQSQRFSLSCLKGIYF